MPANQVEHDAIERCHHRDCAPHWRHADDLIGRIDLWPDDGSSRDQRGFWLDPEFQRQGLMTEAAERVTEYAFIELGWPHLWLTNAQENHASRRIKEKQGARLVDIKIGHYVGGQSSQMVWLLTREDWLARRPWADAPSIPDAGDRLVRPM